MTIPKRVCTCCSDSVGTTNSSSSSNNNPPIVALQWSIIMNDMNHNSYVQFIDTTETDLISNTSNNRVVTKPIINNIQLIKNFEKYGYSPIRIRWNVTNEQQQQELHKQSTTTEHNHHYHNHCPILSSSAIELLHQYKNWKSLHSELFDNEIISSFRHNNNNANVDIDTTSIRYIPSESGAPGTSKPECKQSWEYQYKNDNNTRPKSILIHDYNNNNNNNTNQQNNNILIKNRLHGWSEILHTIIYHIIYELHLPIETLIAIQQHGATTNNNYNDNHIDTYQGNDDQQQQSIDLLRAFRYDPIDINDCTVTTTDNNNNSNDNVNKQQLQEQHEQEQLGSSPHTDWGSWTVVWQDDTYPPCLQTYCYSCHKWNNIISSTITTPENDNNDDDSHMYEANFIVHVGDLTSLCVRHSIEKLLMESTTMQEDTTTTTTTTTTTIESDCHYLDITNIWPSPRHRVLSPLYQYRHSLVYFVYPPKSITPVTIIDNLLDWCRTNYISVNRPRKVDRNMLYIPYEDYSILYDQSATAVVNGRKDDDDTDDNNHHNKHQQHLLLLWKSIQTISIDTILTDKWKQVQR